MKKRSGACSPKNLTDNFEYDPAGKRLTHTTGGIKLDLQKVGDDDVTVLIAARKRQEAEQLATWKDAVVADASRHEHETRKIRLPMDRASVMRLDEAKKKRWRRYWTLENEKEKSTWLVPIAEAAILYSDKRGPGAIREFFRGLSAAIERGDFDDRMKLYRALDQPVIRSRFRAIDIDNLQRSGATEDEQEVQLAHLWLGRQAAITWCELMRLPVPARWRISKTQIKRKVGRPNKTKPYIVEFKRREAAGTSLGPALAEANHLVEWGVKKGLPVDQRSTSKTLRRLISEMRKTK